MITMRGMPDQAMLSPAQVAIAAATELDRLRYAAALNLSLDGLVSERLRQRYPTATPRERGVWRSLQRIGLRRDDPLGVVFAAEGQMNDQPISPLRVAARAAAACDGLAIPYLIGGGVAATIHGEFRATRDIDLVIRLTSRQVDAFVQALQEAFIVQPEAVRGALAMLLQPLEDPMPRRQFGSFTAYDRQSGYQLDVFVIGTTPYERVYLERALTLAPPEADRALRFSTAEDSILTKLEWYGITPSERQWSDVQAIVRIQADDLDTAYIAHWATPLGVADLWAALAQGAPPPAAPAADPHQLGLDL